MEHKHDQEFLKSKLYLSGEIQQIRTNHIKDFSPYRVLLIRSQAYDSNALYPLRKSQPSWLTSALLWLFFRPLPSALSHSPGAGICLGLWYELVQQIHRHEAIVQVSKHLQVLV